jgi:NAD-dependent SIR2 family protein deacetylase
MEVKPGEHLIDTILNRSEDRPNYVLFLGAGASWNSGVKTANEMIEIWRNSLYGRSRTRMKYKTWLSKQSWYNTDEEYGYLFGYLYDEQSQRRDYIETILKNASPTWGYVYLASLLQNQIFNAVFTTNFDDLINEACYLYTDIVRPIVCAHDSEVLNVKLTRARPQIIKLHGDFLFNSIIKNTHAETSRLTKNMEAKLVQFGQEYGLVVIGYGGRDNSVMSILEKLITNKNYFKHGIYWCVRRGEEARAKVQKLLEKDRVHVIEIQGFDEFMAELHDKAGLELPMSVINPMKVAEQRSRVFCSVPKQFLDNKVIRKDIEKVLDGLGKVRKRVKGKYVPPDELPLKVKAAIMRRKGELEQAADYLKLDTANNPGDWLCAYDYAWILAELGKTEILKEFVPSSAIDEENKTYFLLFVNNDAVIKQANKVLAIEPGSLIARINRAIVYKRLKKISEMEKDLKAIEERGPEESLRAGIAALRKDKKEMLKMLSIAVNKGILSTEQIKVFPVFEDYRKDEDFKKFTRDIGRKRLVNKGQLVLTN